MEKRMSKDELVNLIESLKIIQMYNLEKVELELSLMESLQLE